MRYSLLLLFGLAVSRSVATLGRNKDKADDLQKVLWNADQQWLCISPPYSKPYKQCVAFRGKYWAVQFFEVSNTGKVQTKAEMVAALVPVIPTKPATSAPQTTTADRKSPHPQLEKPLAIIDQKWMESASTKKLDYLKQLFTGEWAEIVRWNPTVTISKADALDTLVKLSTKSGEGVFLDQFKLMFLYRDVALATDRRTRKYTDPSGHHIVAPHRGLLVFVKQNGQ